MTQKNETPVLLLTFLITAGLIGGGIWFFTQKAGINLGTMVPGGPATNSPTPTTPPTNATSGTAPANTTGGTASDFAQVANVPNGLFSYGGSTSWAPIRAKVDPAIQAAFPSFGLRYTDPLKGTPGSSTGIRMVLDGQIAFAQSSRPLENSEYQQAQQRGFSLKQVPVAIEGIAIAVNPALPVNGLTLAQLRDIYTGKVTNWQQVGGPNLPITPYSRRLEDAGTVEFFMGTVLKGAPFSQRVQSIYSTTDALRKVANNPGSIYYASASEVVPQCTVKPLAIANQSAQFVQPYQAPLVPSAACPAQRNQLNIAAFKSGQYPLTRQLFVVIKQNGQVEQQAGEAYAQMLLTPQGQDLIATADLVKIR